MYGRRFGTVELQIGTPRLVARPGCGGTIVVVMVVHMMFRAGTRSVGGHGIGSNMIDGVIYILTLLAFCFFHTIDVMYVYWMKRALIVTRDAPSHMLRFIHGLPIGKYRTHRRILTMRHVRIGTVSTIIMWKECTVIVIRRNDL